jgi:hypothetical protein
MRKRLLPVRSKQLVAKKAKKDNVLGIQKQAYAALMQAKAANGGELTYGMVNSCARSFENQGFGDSVSARKLRYRVGKVKLGRPAFAEDVPVTTLIAESTMELSPLTEPHVERTTVTEAVLEETLDVYNEQIVMLGNGDTVAPLLRAKKPI